APLRPAEADARQEYRRALPAGVDLQDTRRACRSCREGGHSVDDLPLRGRFHPGKPYVSLLETFGTRDGEPDGGASEFLRRLFLPGWTEARDYPPFEVG